MAHQHKTGAGALRAHRLVNQAVERGDLAHVSSHTCTDCGEPATEYDHRDYSKPLDVVPVCRRCNALRGAGLPLPGATESLKGNGVGFVLTKGHGVSRVKFRYVDFGFYEEPELLKAA